MGLVRPTTVMFLPGEVRLSPADILDDNDPVLKGREHLFAPVEATASKTAARVAQGPKVAAAVKAAAAKAPRARKAAAK
jgi:hypothetical protein